MSQELHFDVIVVGAGPAGSTCASLLANAGLNVLLCDKSRFPRDKICGDCVNPRAWEYFNLLGVSETLRSLDLRSIESVRVSNVAGRKIVVETTQDSSTPFFAIRRSILDNILLHNAGRQGATIVQDTQIVDIAAAKNWNVLVRDANGLKTYTCELLVGADGRNSTVASKIGAPTMQYSSLRSQKRIGIQWHAGFQPNVGSEVQLFTLKDGYLGIVNVDNQTSNIAMVADLELGRIVLSDFPRFVQQNLYSNPSLSQQAIDLALPAILLSTYPINPIRRHWRQSTVFLAGDAHQTVEPFTGEGITFALEDGYRTARKILAKFDKSIPGNIVPKGKFWVNQVVSPVLRNTRVAQSFVSLASQISWLPQLFARTVFRTSS